MTGSATQATVGSKFDRAAFSSILISDGLRLRVGPFNAHIQVLDEDLIEPLYQLYSEYPLLNDPCVCSFRAKIERSSGRWPWRKPLVKFSVDGVFPHEDMPAAQALAVLEWGINLVIAMRSHCFLILHSAVLEKCGHVILLPAAPGYGKTTLCAALAHRGWRLLSDEFGLIRPGTQQFVSVPRPMALKNESIDVFRSFAPDAWIGPSITGTRKGTVAHVKPPADSVHRQREGAPPRWIVFPRWRGGTDLDFGPLSKSEGFMMLAMNAFNYELLGEIGYTTAADIVAQCDCYRLLYSDLEEAVACLDQLAECDESG